MPRIHQRIAPAKINLALHVTGRREDGYHLLESLVVFTRHGDRLQVCPADRDSFSVTGRYADLVPQNEANLVLRARDLLRERFGIRAPVAIGLEKRLPVAAGIGGGSSDAAAAMTLLADLWELEITQNQHAALALELGADVPMCLAASPLLARGIGDKLETVQGVPELSILLINPGRPLATPDVFSALSWRDNPPLPAFSGGNFSEILHWLRTTRNDLGPAALSLLPEIGDTIDALHEHGAVLARMSGSGATCFGIFETEAQATRAESIIAGKHPEWFVEATTTLPSSKVEEHV